MIKRICPICEQTMKRNHYCSVCRRFIKNPRISDSHYYLNESHPSYEVNCEYHNPPQKENTGRQPQALPGPQPPQRKPGPVYAPARRTKNSSSPEASAFLVIVVIMLLVAFLMMLIPVLMFAV